jgi:hypothetical protein
MPVKSACLLTLLLLASLAIPRADAANPAAPVDQGKFKVFWNDAPLGYENFSYQVQGDSLMVHAQVVHLPDRSNTQDTLVKDMVLILRNVDQDLIGYKSSEIFRGQNMVRGLVVNDTAFTSYYQVNGSGVGDRLVRPPGRMFVIDRSVFVLYDFIGRSLHGKTFDQRPVTMFTLGRPDTLIEAVVTDLGTEAIPWGGKTVKARKLRISDPGDELYLWISPQGQMLRWTQPAYALRVEREAPPVKRRAKPRAG